MFKATWRLCKLYENSGICTDVDLVPYLDIEKDIPNDVAFCSCISAGNDAIFQAFMYNSNTKSPLILCFISYLLNKYI